MTSAVVYDTGMLTGLVNRNGSALAQHSRIQRSAIPLLPGPVVAQTWRSGRAAQFGMVRYLRDCHVVTDYGLQDYKRIGVMLGMAVLPPKKRPDVVDALVVLTAARYGTAAILTSDPADLDAYAATLPKARITVRPV